MKTMATLMAVAALTLSAQQSRAGSDEVPTLDINKSCHVDTQAYASGSGGAASCLADEQKAREVLVSQWTQFTPESRTNCAQSSTDIAGAQSYVELLTCLQMAKDVQSLPR